MLEKGELMRMYGLTIKILKANWLGFDFLNPLGL